MQGYLEVYCSILGILEGLKENVELIKSWASLLALVRWACCWCGLSVQASPEGIRL